MKPQLVSALACLAALGTVGFAATGRGAENDLIQNGQVGFIVSSIQWGLTDEANEAPACPDGLSLSHQQILERHRPEEAARRPEETDRQHSFRLFLGSATAPDGSNLCLNPTAVPHDEYTRTVTGNVQAYGIDLDGQSARANGAAASGTCAHDDFAPVGGGARSVDNQMYRLLGCTTGFRSGGIANTFETEMLTGAWGILIDLQGVDDVRNDPDVTVGIHASADPIEVSAARAPIGGGTYAIDPDPRFRATTHGRIVNGVLTTEPVNTRFHWTVNGMHIERALNLARLRMTIAPDGSAEGYLSGYTPIEDWYDNNYRFNGHESDGTPSPTRKREISATGAANSMNYTCNGVYEAMHRLADGERDPQTGQCTSLSTQYRIRAVSAFVVDGNT
jgi:hypothetical protein